MISHRSCGFSSCILKRTRREKQQHPLAGALQVAIFIKKPVKRSERANSSPSRGHQGGRWAVGTRGCSGSLPQQPPCSAVKQAAPSHGGRPAWNKTIQVGLSAHLHELSTQTWRDRHLNAQQKNDNETRADCGGGRWPCPQCLPQG